MTALRERWGDVHGAPSSTTLAEQVVAGESDPYAAADALLASYTDLTRRAPFPGEHRCSGTRLVKMTIWGHLRNRLSTRAGPAPCARGRRGSRAGQ